MKSFYMMGLFGSAGGGCGRRQQQAIWWYVMMPVEWRIVILTRELVDDDDVEVGTGYLSDTIHRFIVPKQ